MSACVLEDLDALIGGLLPPVHPAVGGVDGRPESYLVYPSKTAYFQHFSVHGFYTPWKRPASPVVFRKSRVVRVANILG